MSLQTTAGSLFSYFTSFGGTAAYIAWASITFVHLRVRGAAKRKGIDAKEFPYTAPGHISIYWGNFFFNIFLLLIQGFTVFETPFNYSLFIASYISIPVFFLMFFGYKWWFKTKWSVVASYQSKTRYLHSTFLGYHWMTLISRIGSTGWLKIRTRQRKDPGAEGSWEFWRNNGSIKIKQPYSCWYYGFPIFNLATILVLVLNLGKPQTTLKKLYF